MDLNQVIEGIISREKGYVDNPIDRGGPTNFGITQAVARANGYTGDMKMLPRSFAASIYSDRYIMKPLFDKIYAIDRGVGEELIDTGVNMGPAVAATFFQRCLNVFNYSDARSGYSDVFADGRIGPITINAFSAYMKWRGATGATVMLRALNSEQGHRYIDIAERDPKQRAFTFGWFANRVVI